MAPEIWFPNLGIEVQHLSRVCFNIANIPVYWYGVIMTTAIICGALYAAREAKRIGLNPDIVFDFVMYGLVGAIIGARAYYVAFSWESYKDNPIKVFALREGGLAVYGGIIGGLLVMLVFTKIKKLNVPEFLDVISQGFVLGQAIGRWGNFFNREAFGGYTENLFAMRYLKQTVSQIPESLMDKLVTVNGAEYIQVHPTFLYESIWNLSVFVLLVIYSPKKTFNGEVSALYFLLYGIGRYWIEGMRLDQLQFGNSNIAVSQVLSAIIAALSLIFIVYSRKKAAK